MGAPRHVATWSGIAVVLVSTAAAVVVRWVVPLEFVPSPFTPFFFAVVLSTGFAGLGAGVITTAIGAAALFVLFPPLNQGPAASLPLYAGMSLGLAWVISWTEQRTHQLVRQRTAELRQANAALRKEVGERQRAQTALAEERNFVDALFDAVGTFVYVLDEDGTIVRVNRACEVMLEYNLSEISGQPFFELIPDPTRRQSAVTAFQHLTSNPLPAEYEFQWITRSGRELILHWSMTRLVTKQGNYVIGSGIDVTEQRKLEATLREEKERFARVFANAPTGMALLAPDSRPTQINEAFARMMGFGRDEMLGMNVADLMDPADLDQSEQDRSKLLSADVGVYRAERRLRHRNGSEVWADVSVSALRDVHGTLQSMIAQLRDITAHKRIEAELRESEMKFRVLAETVAVAIFLYRGDRNLYVNRRAEELSGRSREELLAIPTWEIIHPDWRPLARERGTARQRGEAVAQHYVLQILRPDGQARWIDYTAAVVNFEGAPTILGTAFDVTDLKNAEEQVRQREAELAHVLRLHTIGEMAAELAHEINQPLAAIVNYARGCTRRIDSGNAVPQEIRETVELIAAEGLRAGEVIRRLRQHIRKDTPARANIDLHHLIRSSLQFVEREARDADVSIKLSLHGEPIPVAVDAVQIEQVVLNVLRNAMESLQSKSEPNRTIHITSRATALAELVIEDNGQGFAGDIAPRLFQPFFTTKVAGLGMGLSISRSIIEAHGGTIKAESAAHGGARIQIRLPHAEESLVYVH